MEVDRGSKREKETRKERGKAKTPKKKGSRNMTKAKGKETPSGKWTQGASEMKKREKILKERVRVPKKFAGRPVDSFASHSNE